MTTSNVLFFHAINASPFLSAGCGDEEGEVGETREIAMTTSSRIALYMNILTHHGHGWFALSARRPSSANSMDCLRWMT